MSDQPPSTPRTLKDEMIEIQRDNVLSKVDKLMFGRVDSQAAKQWEQVVTAVDQLIGALLASAQQGDAVRVSALPNGNRQIDLVCRSWNQIAYHVNGEERQRTLTLSTPEDASKVWTMISTAHISALPPEKEQETHAVNDQLIALYDAIAHTAGITREIAVAETGYFVQKLVQAMIENSQSPLPQQETTDEGRCEQSLGMGGKLYRCHLPEGHDGCHLHDVLAWSTPDPLPEDDPQTEEQ